MSDWRYCGDGKGNYAGTYVDLDLFRQAVLESANPAVRCKCGAWIVKALHADGGDAELHWVCEPCRKSYWACDCGQPGDR